MERPLRPAGRLPRPARRPLVRLRATHQGPYRAREGTTGGRSRRVAYGITRVKGNGNLSEIFISPLAFARRCSLVVRDGSHGAALQWSFIVVLFMLEFAGPHRGRW